MRDEYDCLSVCNIHPTTHLPPPPSVLVRNAAPPTRYYSHYQSTSSQVDGTMLTLLHTIIIGTTTVPHCSIFRAALPLFFILLL